MSYFGILNDVTVELRRQVFAAIQETPGFDFNLSGGTVEQITASPPSETLDPGDSGILASFYLYHVDISEHARNQLPLPDRNRPNTFRKPPLPLQLRYLFTPVSDDESTNQMLLGRVLQHFHDYPSFETLDKGEGRGAEEIGDAFGGGSSQLRVKPDLLSLEQLSQLWNAFSSPYRVALGFLVEVVAVDSGLPPERRQRVDEFLTVTGKVAP